MQIQLEARERDDIVRTFSEHPRQVTFFSPDRIPGTRNIYHHQLAASVGNWKEKKKENMVNQRGIRGRGGH